MAYSLLEEIKNLRKKFNLNQKELAERAGVSQSLIAKIEAGKIDPSYSKAQQILAALNELREKKEIKAKELMNHHITFAKFNDSLKETIKRMKHKSISQMPVMQQEKVCGIISESTIIQKIADHPEKMQYLTVGEVMEEVPPIVSLNTGQKMLIELLKNFPIVLVAEKGDIKGIISKTDLLGRME